MPSRLPDPQRSDNMRRIRSKDTLPERRVRSLVYRLGFRFRLGGWGLPGRPDLVFPGKRRVVFVHGCFWHQHQRCNEGRVPGSNQEYWRPKLERNVQRDLEIQRVLAEAGWEYMVVWECELRDIDALAARLCEFLS